LGPFIAAMAGENIHTDLINCYIEVAGSTSSTNMGDNDTIYHCAYNFPAVLLTLGPESWLDLKIIYKKLAKDS
jgi:serine/threonine-protein phosphatase 4 regulatory subunit 1